MRTNAEISNIFEEIGFLLELKGENIFKIRAYYNASFIIKEYPVQIYGIQNREELKKIKGIGEAISGKILEIIETGDCNLHRKLLKEFPPFVFELKNIAGLGAKFVKKIFFEKNIKNISELKKVLYSEGLEEILPYEKIEKIKKYFRKERYGKT